MREKALPGFMRFWDAFGNKIARPIAYRAWVKNGCEDMADEIIAAIKNYDAHLSANPWKAKMHPSTFLNQQRYYDEYPEAKKTVAITISRNYGNPERVDMPAPMTEEERQRRSQAVARAKDIIRSSVHH